MINIRQTPARDLPPLPDSGYDLTPPGQVRLAPGDVLRLPQGGDVMVVTLQGSCRRRSTGETVLDRPAAAP